MQFRSRLGIERRNAKRRKIMIVSVNICCLLVLACGIMQCVQVITHCGKDFRFMLIWDPVLEQIIIFCLQIVFVIVGLMGMWLKRGAVFFVAISFLMCTAMIQHFVDLLMGLNFLYSYGTGLAGNQGYLEVSYKYFHLNEPYAVKKVNHIQSCKLCCGISGPSDPQVQLNDRTLIPSCCPPTENGPCTEARAYKDGCARKLQQDDEEFLRYHGISIFSIILQFYVYRIFLHIFV